MIHLLASDYEDIPSMWFHVFSVYFDRLSRGVNCSLKMTCAIVFTDLAAKLCVLNIIKEKEFLFYCVPNDFQNEHPKSEERTLTDIDGLVLVKHSSYINRASFNMTLRLFNVSQYRLFASTGSNKVNLTSVKSD